MDRFALILAVLVAGALFPVQSVVNARLGESVGGPIWAAFASFAVGTMLLLACAYLVAGPPRLAGLSGLPWWVWVGGAIGALLVTVMVIAAPRLGTGALLSLIVGAQILAALALAHHGVLQPVRTIGPWQVVGAVLLVAGVALIVLAPRR